MIGGGAVAGYHIHQAKEQKVTKEEWQAAYKDWVGKWSDDTRFELFDMNGDDVPGDRAGWILHGGWCDRSDLYTGWNPGRRDLPDRDVVYSGRQCTGQQ